MRLFTLLLVYLVFGVTMSWSASDSRATSRPATNDEMHLLNEALTKTGQEMGRWAYTETVVMKDEKGKEKENRVVRHDPSQPYPEQDIPLSIRGEPPSEKKLKEFRQRGEKRGKRAENKERLGAKEETSRQQSVGDIVDVSRALVVGEEDDRLTYELPLRKIGNTRFPPEKFQVLVRVAKAARTPLDAAVTLREPLRAKVVLKISSGDVHVDFASVDPKFAPTLTAVRGDASASILFVSVGGTLELKRTEFKRVKPYDEKFDVQVGPMRALDF